MNRITQIFLNLRKDGRKALIPYITPEFPVRGATVPVLQAVAKAGADIIELGIPFSDPIADGTTIQHSSHVALKNGVTVPGVLLAVREFRLTSDVPIVLMGYVNPILRFGIKEFTHEAKEAGVDGLLVPDLPPEEAGELMRWSRENELSNIFMMAPTTGEDRMRMIDESSTDFSYCVSLTGITGARASLGNGSLDAFLARVRKVAKKPFVVGFGLSTREHILHVWRVADGAVVGSALISRLATTHTPDAAAQAAGEFVTWLRAEHG
ncbi:MAG: tryptophan synthase subunit alpha [Bacteroidota bacterium]